MRAGYERECRGRWMELSKVEQDFTSRRRCQSGEGGKVKCSSADLQVGPIPMHGKGRSVGNSYSLACGGDREHQTKHTQSTSVPCEQPPRR